MIFNQVGILEYFNDSIHKVLTQLQTDMDMKTTLILLATTFLYGIIHSAGPGHGKTLTATYFLKEKHPLRKSFFLSAIISLIHSGSAVCLAFLFSYIFTNVTGILKIKIQSHFMLISGVMILMVGILLLIEQLVKKFKKSEHLAAENANIFLIGLSAGIVPCPAALMIMTFTISSGIMYVGLIAVASISVGMFVVLSVVGAVTIFARQGVLSVSGHYHKAEQVAEVVEYLTIILIFIIGGMMTLTFIV